MSITEGDCMHVHFGNIPPAVPLYMGAGYGRASMRGPMVAASASWEFTPKVLTAMAIAWSTADAGSELTQAEVCMLLEQHFELPH